MDWPIFLTYFAACAGAGATGALFPPGAWYRALAKPTWTPPDWVFPVVWSTLYVLMAWSAMRIAMLPGTGQALPLWSLQIALNGLWTPVFFGLQRLKGGMVALAALWLAVAATMVAFWGHDWVAGLMFAPYLLWVTVAGALNFSVWRLNRG